MIAVFGLLMADTPNPDTVTPGPVGFLAIAFVAIAVVLLGFDLVRRIRRTTYRAEIQERLAEEARAAQHPNDPDVPTPPDTPRE
jgi:hypothetical protein